MRVTERTAVASFSAGCAPAGDEQKVTQWLLLHLSTTGLQMFEICSVRLRFFTRLRAVGVECSEALRRLCHTCVIFSFPPRSFCRGPKSIKLEKGDGKIWTDEQPFFTCVRCAHRTDALCVRHV